MRMQGYAIGTGVRLGFGSVLEGDSIKLGNGVQIAARTVIKAGSIHLGEGVTIGRNCLLDAQTIEIGDYTEITSDVRATGFPHPRSLLKVGRHCIVMYYTYIDTSREVRIGDHVGIGGHCLIFTHGSWMNSMQGYPVQFDAVSIETGAWLPWRVFVMPGSKIGAHSLVGAGSLVRGSIPAECMAAGLPAKVLKPLGPKPLDLQGRGKLAEKIIQEFVLVEEMLSARQVKYHSSRDVEVHDKSRLECRVMLIDSADSLPRSVAQRAIMVSLSELPPHARSHLDAQQVPWLDLEAFEASRHSPPCAARLIAIFKRYGVRFSPTH